MEHGEDLVQLNGGSGSFEHLVWGHRARQHKIDRNKAQQAAPDQSSYPVFDSLSSGVPALDVVRIAGGVGQFRVCGQ